MIARLRQCSRVGRLRGINKFAVDKLRSATLVRLTLLSTAFSSPEPRVDPRLWETLRRRTCAVGFLQPKIGYLSLRAPAHSSC